MSYEVTGFIKFAEEDSFENGCLPETSRCMVDKSMRFVGATKEDLIAALMEFVGCKDKGSVLLDACDEIGRVDIQVMETDEGHTAGDRDIEYWRANMQRLWLCDYSFRVEQVERVTVSMAA